MKGHKASLRGFSVSILTLCIFTSAAKTFAKASLCGRVLCFRAGVGAVAVQACVEEDAATASLCVEVSSSVLLIEGGGGGGEALKAAVSI